MQEILHRLHHELDDRHWWFAARRRIVLDLLARELRADARAGRAHTRGRSVAGLAGTRTSALAPARPRILDIGCGGGATLRELTRLGEAAGLDAEPAAVKAARRRAGGEVRLGRLPDAIPFEPGSFDVVTLLDVLEHIEDDAASLVAIERLLAPGGLLLVTVPAYRFLWSEHDVVNEHCRRYTRPLLRRRLEAAGLRVRRISYYNSLLFPPIAAVRALRGWSRGGGSRRRDGEEPRPDLGAVPAPVNALLRGIFGAERHWLRFAAFPFGVSVLALARKPGGPA